MNELLGCLGLLGLALIPVENAFIWAYHQIRRQHAQLDTPKTLVYFCKYPLVIILSKLIVFSKGLTFPLVMATISENEGYLLLLITGLLISQLWLPKTKEKTANIPILLWGLLSWMHLANMIIFPLLYGITFLTLKSKEWALMSGLGFSGIVILSTKPFGLEFFILIICVSLISITWAKTAN